MAHRNWLTAGTMCAVAAVIIATGAFFYFQAPCAADDRAMILPVDPAPLVAVTKSGERSFSVEVADNEPEREAGLDVSRRTCPSDHGMLFVFDEIT